jgi:hypothetical protein
MRKNRTYGAVGISDFLLRIGSDMVYDCNRIQIKKIGWGKEFGGEE